MSASDTIAKLNRKLQVKIRVATREASKEIIALVIELVKIRVRFEKVGKDGSLRRLEAATIKFREKYASRLHKDTTPTTSNLTATGQMLDALTGKLTGSKVTVFVKNSKRKRELSGGKSVLTNEEVRKWVEDPRAGNREFLVLTEEDKQQIIEVAIEIIRQNVRNLLK